nr:reverse transcriptase domain-containing protein [Tanacetum cinerariifolium]
MSRPKLSPVPYWLWPGYNKTDADWLQVAFATHLRKVIRLREHDGNGTLPDNGPTPINTIIREILGNSNTMSVSGSPEPWRDLSGSPRKRGPEKKTVFKRMENGVFHRLGDKERSLSEEEDSAGGHWKSRSKRQKSSIEEDDLSSPWKAFLENYLHQKKCIKDPIEIHNIKKRDGESTKEFVRRYKLECRDVKGASECMKISGFVHGITNPELIKHLHDKIPKSVDELMRVTTTFLRCEVAASNRERKKSILLWK